MQTIDETLDQAWAALNNGDTETAGRLCSDVLEQVKHPYAFIILANIREKQNRLAEGIDLLEQAQKIGGERANNYLLRTRMMLKLLEDDPVAVPDGLSQADAYFRRGIELFPDYYRLRREYAELLNRMGRPEEAIEYIQPILDHPPVPAKVLTTFSRLAPKLDQIDLAMGLLEEALANGQLSPHDKSDVLAAIANLHDRQGDYDRAFMAMCGSNEIQNQDLKAPHFEQRVDKIIAVFNSDTMARLHRANNDSKLPVYIVGQPRSGTTLVEQILASHPQVFGGGEVKNIFRLRDMLPRMASGRKYPEAIPFLDAVAIDQLAKEHIDYLTVLGNGAARVTSKQPTYFLYLGLVALLAPNARIINCRRNLLDVCIALYFQPWIIPGCYIKTFDSMAQFCRGYERLMSHWHQVLDIPILDVDYEKLVGQHEATVREMLEFLDLPWDESCLRFHQNDRFVHTASYDQVREPIYDRSIGRWRNYEKHLGPLRELLDV